jgi:hypothetical protein
MMDYGFGERRNKRKDKFKERKKHPYRQGGQFRTMKFGNKENEGAEKK